MGTINDILNYVDTAVDSVAKSGFEQIAGSLGHVITISSSVLIGLLGVNIVMQISPMTWASFFGFVIKLSLVIIFVQSWSNFEVVYTIATDVPEAIGAAIVNKTDLGTTGGLYDALDEMVYNVTAYGDAIGDNAGWVFGAFLGVMMFVIASLFAAIAAGIIAYAKIVLSLMIIVAPISITCSLFKPTMPIFESWTRSIIGYAFMPIAAAGAAGLIVSIAKKVIVDGPDPDNVSTLNTIFPFMVILILSAGLMAAVPTIASGLSGAVNLASNAAGLTGLAQRGVVKTGKTSIGLAGKGIGAGISKATSGTKYSADTAGSLLNRINKLRGK